MSSKAIKILYRKVSACQKCSELPLGPRPIFQLNPKAKILIAGQAPGKRAHEKNIPFDDPSGDRLRAWLGVTRDQFYDDECFAILPMAFCFPGTGSGGDLAPPAICASSWRQPLLDTLGELQLTLVIGQYAQAWHLPEQTGKKLTDTVRVWQDYWPDRLPMPHPSPRNNRWLKQNPWFEAEVIPALQARVASLI